MAAAETAIDPIRQLRHDLRGHLQTIALSTEIMIRVADPVQRAKCAGAIQRAIQAINELLAEGKR